MLMFSNLLFLLVSITVMIKCNGSVNSTSRSLASTCNIAAFKAWQAEIYEGTLATDSNFWRYQTQTDFPLTNGLALELAVASCKNRFNLLRFFKAGRTGPVDIQNCYKVMCKADCLESDKLHEEAMSRSSCSCLELSTQPNDPSFSSEGDWCRENTARMLCSETGFCGVWNCRIDDFMCPRYEWNKKRIPLKGAGHCDRSSATMLKVSSGATLSVFACLVLYFAW